jgi:superoxide dismutase, Cu-Zn family
MISIRRSWLGISAALLALTFTSIPSPIIAQSPSAYTDIYDLTNTMVGRVQFEQIGNQVEVHGEFWGLAPGFHGFHVHTVPTCDPATTFASAGGHLNPNGMAHPQHDGDLPPLYITADGTGSAAFMTEKFSVDALLQGASVVIHAGPDNLSNIPERYAPAPDAETLNAGDSGGRIACGTFTGIMM